MTALVTYTITAVALIAALWALPWWWMRTTSAADTYRRDWTRDRKEPTWLLTSMRKLRGAR